MITNIEIEFFADDPNHCAVRALFFNSNSVFFLPWPDPLFNVAGAYRHVLVRDPSSGWRSSHLWEEILYNQVYQAVCFCSAAFVAASYAFYWSLCRVLPR